MKEVIYKQKDGTYKEFNSAVPNTFNGYKITKYYHKISSIVEYEKGKQLGIISFRPTTTPVISFVEYGNYIENRYNNGSVSTIAYYSNDVNGQSMRYQTDGTLLSITYYHNGVDVTQDVKDFVNFKGSDIEFTNYKFSDEELFNIYMFYGNKFKFYNEYKMDSKYFNEVATFCLN